MTTCSIKSSHFSLTAFQHAPLNNNMQPFPFCALEFLRLIQLYMKAEPLNIACDDTQATARFKKFCIELQPIANKHQPLSYEMKATLKINHPDEKELHTMTIATQKGTPHSIFEQGFLHNNSFFKAIRLILLPTLPRGTAHHQTPFKRLKMAD